MVPSDRDRQSLRQTQLHTSDGKGVCIVSQLAHTTSRLSPSAFEGTHLKGTPVMDGRRYQNNNSSWKGGNLVENSLFSYCPGRRKKPSQPVQSHETSDPSKGALNRWLNTGWGSVRPDTEVKVAAPSTSCTSGPRWLCSFPVGLANLSGTSPSTNSNTGSEEQTNSGRSGSIGYTWCSKDLLWIVFLPRGPIKTQF